jgi:hypothetical protein
MTGADMSLNPRTRSQRRRRRAIRSGWSRTPCRRTPRRNGDRVVIGMIVGRDETERQAIVGRAFQVAVGKHPRGIAIDPEPQKHAGMIGLGARPAIARAHRAKIEPVDDLDEEPHAMALRQSLVHRRRPQKTHVAVEVAEVAHRGKPGARTASYNSRPSRRVALSPTNPNSRRGATGTNVVSSRWLPLRNATTIECGTGTWKTWTEAC